MSIDAMYLDPQESGSWWAHYTCHWEWYVLFFLTKPDAHSRHFTCDLQRPCGPMDKASDYESGDCRFESCQGQIFFKIFSIWLSESFIWFKRKATESFLLESFPNFSYVTSQEVAWPSGLRRWFKAPVSSGAWVRIPLQSPDMIS